MSRLRANAGYVRAQACAGVRRMVDRLAGRPMVSTPAQVEKEVLRIVQRTFGPVHPVQPDRSWRTNGADDLDLIEIAIVIEDTLGVPVADQDFIDHPTPAALAARVTAILPLDAGDRA